MSGGNELYGKVSSGGSGQVDSHVNQMMLIPGKFDSEDLLNSMRIPVDVSYSGRSCYQCSFCAKRIHNKNDARKHLRSHTGEKPYKCDVCSKGFTQEHRLRSHVKTHIKIQLSMVPHVQVSRDNKPKHNI